jgi:WD40 repeat protein
VNALEAPHSKGQYRYWAFISYSHADEAWAKWLHRSLETYRIPKRLTRAEATTPRRLLPIFRDTDELPGSSNLGAKLEEALSASRALIVICSPHAAQSKWVDQEIRAFQAAGRANSIFAVIVGGEPNTPDSARECFPHSLRLGTAEPLACDPREDHDGKADCKLRLIAGMLGLNFDELKRRERQRRIRRAVVLSSAGLVLAAVLGGISYYGVRQSNIAESRRNAVKSQEAASQDPVAALDLAIQAARSAPTMEAAQALSNALTFQLTRTVLYHPAPVVSAAFSPDAKRVLTCTSDGIARVWDTQSGRFQFALKSENQAGNNPPRACVFSPDGSLILTITPGLGAKLWNAQSGQMTASLSGHAGQVLAGSFSPDGARAVTAGEDKTARVWDARTGTQQIVFKGHDTSVSIAVFFPDNSRVVSIGSHGKAIVWNVSTGEAIASFGEFVPVVQDAALSPDGKRLLISNYQYSAVLWDPNTGKQITQLTTRSYGVAFTQDSSRLITGSGDGRVTVWESEDGSAVKELSHGSIVSSVLFSPSGSLVVTADVRPHIWNMPELGGGADTEIFSLRGHNAEAVIAGFSKDGKLLLTFGPSDRTVRVWDITGGPHMKAFGEPDTRVGDALFSPDGSRFLTSGDRIQVWDTSTAQRLATTQIAPAFSLGEQFSANGARIMSYCLKGSVCVFDTSTGALVAEIDNVHTLQAALSPDGSQLAVAAQDNSVGVYRVPGGNRLNTFPGDQDSPTSIVFSPDGRQILVAVEGVERVWDIATQQQVRTLKGYGALFSRDSALLATMQANTARWYHAADGRLLEELRIPANAIETIAFSHDSAWLAAGSTDGVIKVWEVKTGHDRLSLNPKDGRVRVLQFSADDRNLIAVTDGAIHCYSTGNGNEWQTFRNNFGLINAAVAPDGSRVVGADTLGRALLYSFQFEDLLEAARKRLPATGSAP